MKRALALILSLVMMLALFPATAMAVGEVAVAMEGAPQNGDKVVMYYPAKSTVVSTIASDNKLEAVDVTLADGSITLPANAAIFDVAVNEAGEYAFAIDGKYLTTAETGSTLTFAESLTDFGLWILESEGTDAFLIKNKKAAYNGNPQYIEFYNQFTTYKLNSNHTAYTFRFFKLTNEVAVIAPTADPAAGTVSKGATVKLTTATEGADIYWKIGEDSTFAKYTAPIAINEDCVLFAYAEKDGKQSATAEFAYTVFEGAMSIKQALEAGDVASAKVVGQLVYRFGNFGSINSAIVQAKIDGEVYALQCYNSLDTDTSENAIEIGEWLV
ncbi:MAG: chitobiase/beta-hexosaminidase C-terminal domain-containing protein, partial [Clostridia bacterium]|nr:chitobiase/beta-hexosaminidase C-terminal domain-containing protein [Clostridia bacterium]